MTLVHFLVPESVTDPARPTGGNHYDWRLAEGLRERGWDVRLLPVPDPEPEPEPPAVTGTRDAVERALSGLTPGALVVVDAWAGCAAAASVTAASSRLDVVVLAHMPFGAAPDGDRASAAESTLMRAAAEVIATSHWTREQLIVRYRLPPERVHVAPPGVEAAALATGTREANSLLCVGAVTELKGHDVLMSALTDLRMLDWTCTVVGRLDAEPVLVERLRRQVATSNLADRIRFAGVLVGGSLARAYDGADVLVVPSRFESYGMVIAEALARGLPVVASDVGGVREALGAVDGDLPGLLVPAGDGAELRTAVDRWLTTPDLRESLRSVALARRAAQCRWQETTDTVAALLSQRDSRSR